MKILIYKTVRIAHISPGSAKLIFQSQDTKSSLRASLTIVLPDLVRRFMAEILPIRRKTLSNQSVNRSILIWLPSAGFHFAA